MIKLFLAVVFAISTAMVIHGGILIKAKTDRITEKQKEREQKFINSLKS